MAKLNFHEKSYRDVRAVVLGASGFIGRWVARHLCLQEAEVYLVGRGDKAVRDIMSKYQINGQIMVTDLSDPVQIRQLVEKIRPSIIFNLAGYGVDRSERDQQTAYQINAALVETICQITVDTRDPHWPGQDIVHVGSALEYGTISGNLAEDSIPNPTTLYGMSKLAGTRHLTHYCQAYGIKGLTARLFTIYGHGEHSGRLLPSLLETAKTGNPLQLTSGKQKRDFTYVEDVAEGLLRLGLSESKPGEIINLATGRLTSIREFVKTASHVLMIPKDRLLLGALPIRSEEMEHDNVTVERLKKLVQWTPETNIAEGIQKTQGYANRLRLMSER